MTTKIENQLRSLNPVAPEDSAVEAALAASRRRSGPTGRPVFAAALVLSVALNTYLLLTSRQWLDHAGVPVASEQQDKPAALEHSVTIYAAVPGDRNPESTWRIGS